MKRIGFCLLVAGLIVSAGCVNDSAQKRNPPPKTTAKTEPAPGDTPPAPVQVVASEKLNAMNANEQADAEFKILMKDRREMGRTDTAAANSSEEPIK